MPARVGHLQVAQDVFAHEFGSAVGVGHLQAAAFGDTATAKVELAQYVESFGNTVYGDEARLLLGQIYLESGQTDQAVTLLQDAADLSKPIGVQVAILLGKAHEQKGDLKAAEEAYLRVADRSPLDFQIRAALEALGEGGYAEVDI